MPNNLEFLLRYSIQEKQENSKNKILKSLDMMAYGGIFDHVEGGFSRYSTDERWHVSHFEKMLYDNGQLMSLYSVGYKISKNELYKQTIYKIHEYINSEMKDFQVDIILRLMPTVNLKMAAMLKENIIRGGKRN